MNRQITPIIGSCHDPFCQLCRGSASIKSQSATLWEYLETALDLIELEHARGNSTPIKLAIVGRDPYPEEAIGIPFAKPTIAKTASSLSGGVIFRSLGVDIHAWRGKDVKVLFEKLLKQRIVFLNASYVFLGKGPLVQGKHGAYLHCANTANSIVFNGAEQVVLCGEAAKGYKWVNGLKTKSVLPPKFHCAPHPSARVYNRNEAEFQKYWAPGALVNMFNLQTAMSTVNHGL